MRRLMATDSMDRSLGNLLYGHGQEARDEAVAHGVTKGRIRTWAGPAKADTPEAAKG